MGRLVDPDWRRNLRVLFRAAWPLGILWSIVFAALVLVVEAMTPLPNSVGGALMIGGTILIMRLRVERLSSERED